MEPLKLFANYNMLVILLPSHLPCIWSTRPMPSEFKVYAGEKHSEEVTYNPVSVSCMIKFLLETRKGLLWLSHWAQKFEQHQVMSWEHKTCRTVSSSTGIRVELPDPCLFSICAFIIIYLYKLLTKCCCLCPYAQKQTRRNSSFVLFYVWWLEAFYLSIRFAIQSLSGCSWSNL